MGRYIDWDEVIDRYPSLNTLGGSDELSSSYIVYSEAYVDGALGDMYAVPFSNNNMVVKDLCIDYCYWRAGRHKIEDAIAVKSDFFQNLAMVRKGQLNFIDPDGNILEVAEKVQGIASNTGSYHSAFGIDDPVDYRVDPDYIDATRDERS